MPEPQIVACGGLSIPKIGATDLGYRIARQFGVDVIPPRPALVPLLFDDADRARWSDLPLPASLQWGQSPIRRSKSGCYSRTAGSAARQFCSRRPTGIQTRG